MKKLVVSFLIAISTTSYAAIPVNLNYINANMLTSIQGKQAPFTLKETSRDTDFKNTLHIRLQQMYGGYPIEDGDIILHIPNAPHANEPYPQLINQAATVNGKLYENLTADLATAPTYIFNSIQAEKALAAATQIFTSAYDRKQFIISKYNSMLIFVDKQNKAHWAFKTVLRTESQQENILPIVQVYIQDAMTFTVLKQWNAIETLDTVNGGGVGGNKKTGELFYDGQHLSQFSIKRDAVKQVCYLQNNKINIHNFYAVMRPVIHFSCIKPNTNHSNLYWDDTILQINDSYSPANDALYASTSVEKMFNDWYQTSIPKKTDKPLEIFANVNIDNAYWDPDAHQLIVGNGNVSNNFYSFSTPDVLSHEIAHAFTQEWSHLEDTQDQRGALDESFSDITAQALEYYLSGKNDWVIGKNLLRSHGYAIRYMDKPSKDCYGRQPANNCSIDNANQDPTDDSLDVHYASGVYNHFFYLLATSPNWNTKKAYDVMVQANKFYWNKALDFNLAACGVIKATQDYGYDLPEVLQAFKTVKVLLKFCHY